MSRKSAGSTPTTELVEVGPGRELPVILRLQKHDERFTTDDDTLRRGPEVARISRPWRLLRLDLGTTRLASWRRILRLRRRSILSIYAEALGHPGRR
jgi:hypothetical protein